MKLLKTLMLFCVVGEVLSSASSLAVYQDKVLYTYLPKSTFIGFSHTLEAQCEGEPLYLSPMLEECPSEERLCQTIMKIHTQKEKRIVIQTNLDILEQLLTLPKPTVFDATTTIDDAKRIAQEKSKLQIDHKKLQRSLKIANKNFQRQAPDRMAMQSQNICNTPIELSISQGITFSTSYEANILEDILEVTQYLSVVNRSGVDIEADNAMFYYRSAHQHVYPLYFNPWVVRKYVPLKSVSKNMYKRKVSASLSMDMIAEEGGDIAPVMPVSVGSYEDAREYKVSNLRLPSTGLPVELKLLSWKTPLSCEVRAYPYANTRAFHLCSFTPKYQIDSHHWKIKEHGVLINENASGEYNDKKYLLYTKVEEDIQITRKSIVQKERETGIFGGTARKKDGFTLNITNKSDKPKRLTVVERIPTSGTEEISSKLLSVKSGDKVNYKVLKDGKIEMDITLNANESKTIEILFEISYDKELKVNY